MPYHDLHIIDLSMPAPHPSSTLLAAFRNQDEAFPRAFAILQEAINHQAFPALSIAVTHQGSLVALKAMGNFTYDEQGAVHPSTLFDLASLTKVVATTTTAMLLYERGLLDLEAPVSAIVPEFTTDAAKDPRRHEVTLRMLLAHSSGLPAHEKFFLKARTRAELLQAAFTTPLAANPATRAEYSDIGFIILGVALERLADESLDRFCQREIFAPLAMTHTTFNPPLEIRAKIPPTANDQRERVGRPPVRPAGRSHAAGGSTFRGRIIQGEVQDENASVLGGVAPHAGLFSTAEDLAKFAQSPAEPGKPHSPPRNRSPLHPPRIRAPRHITSPGLGHSLSSIAIRKTFLATILRPPRLHRNLPLDRSHPPALNNSANQPHLARLLQPGNQTNPPQLPRRSNRSPGKEKLCDERDRGGQAFSRALSDQVEAGL